MAVLADPTRKPDGRSSKACPANKGNLARPMREPGRYLVSDAPGMFFKVRRPARRSGPIATGSEAGSPNSRSDRRLLRLVGVVATGLNVCGLSRPGVG